MPEIIPRLVEIKVSELRPTQMSIGSREVAQKVRKHKRLSDQEFESVARGTFFPGVIGPNKNLYITNHHHTALALLRRAEVHVQVGIQDDLSMLSMAEFWIFMDHRTWVHCYDTTGRRRPFEEMPAALSDLRDDPYRSLAAAVRENGGFAVLDLPYLEFLWANYFRCCLSTKLVRREPEAALKHAIKLAHSKAASYLPGWTGKS